MIYHFYLETAPLIVFLNVMSVDRGRVLLEPTTEMRQELRYVVKRPTPPAAPAPALISRSASFPTYTNILYKLITTYHTTRYNASHDSL